MWSKINPPHLPQLCHYVIILLAIKISTGKYLFGKKALRVSLFTNNIGTMEPDLVTFFVSNTINATKK